MSKKTLRDRIMLRPAVVEIRQRIEKPDHKPQYEVAIRFKNLCGRQEILTLMEWGDDELPQVVEGEYLVISITRTTPSGRYPQMAGTIGRIPENKISDSEEKEK